MYRISTVCPVCKAKTSTSPTYLHISLEFLEHCESHPTLTFSCQKACKSAVFFIPLSDFFFFFWPQLFFFFRLHLGTAPCNQSQCACLAMSFNSTITLIILDSSMCQIASWVLYLSQVGLTEKVCSLGWNYYETRDRILANRAGHISLLVKSWRLEMYRTHDADEFTVYVKKMSEGWRKLD